MNLFPLFLKLSGRRCLVVGAGKVAEEKIEGLLDSGAEIRVVAPKATPRLRSLAQEKRIRWVRRRFRRADLEDVLLVVAATSSSALHKKIYRQARRRGVLCNVVDDPPNCDFYYGSVVRRGALQIAISTSGYSPSLAQRIRKSLEHQFGPEYQDWMEVLGKARESLFARKMDPQQRKQLLEVLASEEMFHEFSRLRTKEVR
jgi:precorrin-2 dehydrogenase / sirohydrochlorin ferrochelatase